jgi:dihydroorotate dehydrogenase (NAD+) catalytic subunit
MLNSIGLQNPGVREFVKHILPGLRGYGPKVIANIAGHSLHEYALVAGEISAAPDADVLSAIEVNISCPNVHKGGMAFGSHPETADLVISGVRKATTLPIIAKLTPVAADITEVAKACIEAGADALSLINTLPGMVIDTRTRRPLLGHRTGGLSGPAIRPVAVLMVHRVYQVAKRTGIPVIGMGGISNADDALQFILAGASAIGVGTALFWNYSVCREIVDGLRQRLEQEGVSSVAELVGAMRE